MRKRLLRIVSLLCSIVVLGELTLRMAVAGPVAPLRQSSGIGLTSSPILDDGNATAHQVKTVRGGLVHTVTLICPTAPCEVAIYDQTSFPSGGVGASSTPVWEGRMVTTSAPGHWEFSTPLFTTLGVVVQVAGGSSASTGVKAFLTYE